MILSEEHRLLQRGVDQLVERIVRPTAIRLDREDYFPRESFKELGEADFLGILLPAPYGAGKDLLSYALVVETIARASAATAWVYVVHTSSTMAIASSATQEQRKRFLPGLVKGERLVGFAFTEPSSGANFMAIQTSATPHGDGYLVSGSKCFISLAGEADVFLVLAKTGESAGRAQLSALILEKSMNGFATGSRHDGMGMRGISWGELIINNCYVPRENVLAGIGEGIKVVYGMGKVYLLGAAALSLGIAHAAYETTVKHVKERVIEGNPLASYETVRSKLAEMASKLEAARSLVYRACVEDYPRSSLPQEAKLFASETAVEVARAAIQLQGATGYSTELPTERYLRDALAVTLHFENNDVLKGFIGRTLVGA